MSDDIDAETQETCEAALNLVARAIGVLDTVRTKHRRILDAHRSLIIAEARLKDFLGR